PTVFTPRRAYRVPIPGTTQLRGESPDLPASRATSDWISFYTKFFAVPFFRIFDTSSVFLLRKNPPSPQGEGLLYFNFAQNDETNLSIQFYLHTKKESQARLAILFSFSF
ncbi:MAG: hypothetical protein J6K63_02260, partial [Clostridia bacterium]|nr:hypothetical protein [Clostridia bacterium]